MCIYIYRERERDFAVFDEYISNVAQRLPEARSDIDALRTPPRPRVQFSLV